MPDRLQEIRARLDAASPGQPWVVIHETFVRPTSPIRVGNEAWQDAIAHAPADIAWLLGRLDFETRLVADLEAQLDRAHERYAAEIERLRNTKDSSPNPLCDEPVAQGVTKRERPDAE